MMTNKQRTGLWLGIALFTLFLFSQKGFAADSELSRFTTDLNLQTVFPGADRLGEIKGEPPVAAVFKGSEQLGFIFVNSDSVDSTGYSGKPIHLLIAIDMSAVIRKVLLVEHHEPIVLIGIPEQRIVAILDKYIGMNLAVVASGSEQAHQLDAMSGATVSVMVMDDTIVRSGIKVARAYGLGGLKPKMKRSGPTFVVDQSLQTMQDWISLISDGSVRRLKITLAEVNAAFDKTGNIPAIDQAEEGEPNEIFIELYAGLVSAPSIGRSLLGEAEYQNMLKRLEPNQAAILLAANGRYSFKGSGYVRGGIFDRFQITQGDTSVRFHDSEHKRLRRVAADGAIEFTDVDLFRIPADLKFDASLPWTLELLVGRATSATQKAFLTFDLDYALPQRYLQLAPVQKNDAASGSQGELVNTPLWQKMWLAKVPEIVTLIVILLVLTIIFFFQNQLAKHPKWTDRVRVGFLIVTLFGIGFYANAQLSVVNILTVFNAVANGFSWSYFLMEPTIFILWSSVAASLLLWGRGPFCGWLCPFGAFQELLNRIAKAIKIPQIKVPWGVHERLWALKYVIFLVLVGFSLHALDVAEVLAEVEPFKTSIVLKFQREWGFVLFAGVLLFIGLFIERFYCRYVCPLGAALAIPGHLRIFQWLRRYKECGTPCQVCAKECMVGAIHPEGNINPNECLYCLHCQVNYFDDHVCPVMIEKRVKRERRAGRAAAHKQKNSILVSDIKLDTKPDTKPEKKPDTELVGERP
ncbi:MAG: NosR/NirI family nitrous oxide reductase transcriptional regulator [Gammaproteobacteria bacterium]|jgi:NosR/NirI family nitrous oxide reductase transcriptional regulator